MRKSAALASRLPGSITDENSGPMKISLVALEVGLSGAAGSAALVHGYAIATAWSCAVLVATAAVAAVRDERARSRSGKPKSSWKRVRGPTRRLRSSPSSKWTPLWPL